jgi:hypothetical protein
LKIFVSWSGDTSHQVALALRDWLPAVIQEVEPWVSSEDIEKGSQWVTELTRELADTKEGIVCVTSGNSEQSWLAYESGVLAKTTGQTKVRTALFGVTPADIQGPLSTFQHTTLADEADVRKFIDSINRSCQNPLKEQLLERAFTREWPELVGALAAITQPQLAMETPPPRSADDMVEEILGLVRGFGRISSIEEAIADLRKAVVPRIALSPASRAQIRSMRGLIASLVKQKFVSDRELGDMVTPETSQDFDDWVELLQQTNPYGQPADDPWASSPPAQSGYSDEPPF